MQVKCGIADLGVAKQNLDGAQVSAGFQHVCRKAVSKQMRRNALADAGALIANHARCYSRQQKILDLEHYLDVLERKPGALRGSTPLAQWRAQGRWPQSYDRIWDQLIERRGRQHGTRAMVEVIRMGREFGYAKLTTAVGQALEMGCADVAAIRHLLQSDQLRHLVGEPIEIGSLSAYERPLPTMIAYDQLLSSCVQAVQA
jgi:hypothetical protein